MLTSLPVFGDSKAIAISGDSSAKLDEESEILGLLSEALTTSKHKGKSTYNRGSSSLPMGRGW